MARYVILPAKFLPLIELNGDLKRIYVSWRVLYYSKGSIYHSVSGLLKQVSSRIFRTDLIQAAAEGTAGPDGAVKPSNVTTISKKYSNAQVIYKDAQNAFILKPTLQPSAYYGRKPLQKIKKGTTVGIHVIRGFDWKLWEKLHPSKRTKAGAKTEGSAPAAVDTDAGKRNACEACRSQEERPKVTDLVLVIHGIGMAAFHYLKHTLWY
jgi:hypothetical protein